MCLCVCVTVIPEGGFHMKRDSVTSSLGDIPVTWHYNRQPDSCSHKHAGDILTDVAYNTHTANL